MEPYKEKNHCTTLVRKSIEVRKKRGREECQMGETREEGSLSFRVREVEGRCRRVNTRDEAFET